MTGYDYYKFKLLRTAARLRSALASVVDLIDWLSPCCCSDEMITGVCFYLGEDWVLFWGDAKLAVEGVVPHFLHIVPVGDDSVLDGMFNLQNTAFLLSLITDVDFLLVESNHDTWYLGSADDCRED